MSSSLSQANLPTPLLVSEGRAKMAKASVRKTDTAAFYAELGACIDEVRQQFGLTCKEFAVELGKNESYIRRQIEGSERPQLEMVFAVERFRPVLVIALAKRAAGVDVVTEIRVRRSA
jgi:hypothetical protein